MKRRFVKYFLMTALVAAVSSVGCSSAALAQQADDGAKTMALRGIMDQLGQSMQDVAGAIAREDWSAVAELAPQIAEHDEPPATEKVRILAWLGTDALKFRSHDKEMARAAENMGTVARSGDGAEVINAFADVQRKCLACHEAYRADFVQHFYDDH